MCAVVTSTKCDAMRDVGQSPWPRNTSRSPGSSTVRRQVFDIPGDMCRCRAEQLHSLGRRKLGRGSIGLVSAPASVTSATISSYTVHTTRSTYDHAVRQCDLYSFVNDFLCIHYKRRPPQDHSPTALLCAGRSKASATSPLSPSPPSSWPRRRRCRNSPR